MQVDNTDRFFSFEYKQLLGDVSPLNNRIDMSGSARYVHYDSIEENGLHV